MFERVRVSESDLVNFAKRVPEFRERARQLIQTEDQAFQWARQIGDHEEMLTKVHTSAGAYRWMKFIGDALTLYPLLRNHEAYLWARNRGDHRWMIEQIYEPRYLYLWLKKIKHHDSLAARLKDLDPERYEKYMKWKPTQSK
jgi:hypothetical protein